MSSIKTLIDAYIKRNANQEITGPVLNGVLTAIADALGTPFIGEDGYWYEYDQETGEYVSSGTPAQGESGVNEVWAAVGASIEPQPLPSVDVIYNPTLRQLGFTFYDIQGPRGPQGTPGITGASVSVDANVGTPSVDASIVNSILTLAFHNLRGAAAGFGTPTISVGANQGTPSASVTASGPDTAKVFAFAFDGLKGETGPQGPQGPQGNPGSSQDYPFTLANNLTTDDSTVALTAAMGVQLEGEVSQLSQEVDGGLIDYNASVPTNASTNLRPGVDFSVVDIPAGKYNISVDRHGTFSYVIMYFYDADGNAITATNRNGATYTSIADDSTLNSGPFNFPTAIKKIGLYSTGKLTDGTVVVTLETDQPQPGLVDKVNDLIQNQDDISENLDQLSQEVEGKADAESTQAELDRIDTVVFGNDDSNTLSVTFASGVAISGGNRYPTPFALAAGSYNILTGLPSGLEGQFLYIQFFDANGNGITVTDNIGSAYSQLNIPPYESRQPYTFPVAVASVNFYGGTPSEECTLSFVCNDINRDKNVRELIEDTTVQSPDIVLPRKFYLLSSAGTPVENSIYHKHYMSFQNPQFAMDAQRGDGWRYTPRCFRIMAQGSIPNPTFYLRNIPKHTTVGTFAPQVVTGLRETNNGAKVINVIGDSFTYNGTWYKEISELCTGLSFVGMRQSYNAPSTMKAEGRGGWTLEQYFAPHGVGQLSMFSPFMHVQGYTYYGVIDFWKIVVNGDSPDPYGTDGFESFASWFDANGYKVNPQVNDLMFDFANDKYVYYNGTAWVDFNGTPSFSFNYAKYINTWNIAAPDFVIVMLGVNDFVTGISDAFWATWKSRMDELVASVKAYGTSINKDITIGICTPTVRHGAENGSLGVNQDFLSYGLFSGRKRIIEEYDTAENEAQGVFVVDTGVAVDTEYGWVEWETESNEKPFSYYTGTFREFYGYNDPHPSTEGYKQIGVVGAAFIQSKR